MNNKCCFQCNERKMLCHSMCEKYAKMKEEVNLIKIKRNQFLDGWGYDGCLAPKNGKARKYEKAKF